MVYRYNIYKYLLQIIYFTTWNNLIHSKKKKKNSENTFSSLF